MPFRTGADAQEKRLFQHFAQRTIPSISSEFDLPFWKVDVMRASQAHPAIWHAVIALVAMHSRLETPDDASSIRQLYYVLALKHYNASVKHLMSISSRDDQAQQSNKEIVLTASILYSSLCCLQGDAKDIMMHAHHGIQLFYQWRLWEPSNSGPLLQSRSLEALINRLECQVVWKGTRRPWHDHDVVRQPSEAPFTSYTDAYLELIPLISGMFNLYLRGVQYSAEQCHPKPDPRLHYQRALGVWREKYATFQRSHTPTKKDAVQELVLRLWLVPVDMMLRKDRGQFEMELDRNTPRYKDMVDTAEEIIAEEEITRTNSKVSPRQSISYAPSVCEPLYLLSLHCRDTVIRHRALELMKRCSPREGLWDSRLLYTIANTIVGLEESGDWVDDLPTKVDCRCKPGAYVCQPHRAASRAVEFTGPREAKLYIKSMGHVTLGLPGRLEVITW